MEWPLSQGSIMQIDRYDGEGMKRMDVATRASFTRHQGNSSRRGGPARAAIECAHARRRLPRAVSVARERTRVRAFAKRISYGARPPPPPRASPLSDATPLFVATRARATTRPSSRSRTPRAPPREPPTPPRHQPPSRSLGARPRVVAPLPRRRTNADLRRGGCGRWRGRWRASPPILPPWQPSWTTTTRRREPLRGIGATRDGSECACAAGGIAAKRSNRNMGVG